VVLGLKRRTQMALDRDGDRTTSPSRSAIAQADGNEFQAGDARYRRLMMRG
jgi:hypothetical protein